MNFYVHCIVKKTIENSRDSPHAPLITKYRGDEIPVELFQILKDDAVKVLHSICQQIWKT